MKKITDPKQMTAMGLLNALAAVFEEAIPVHAGPTEAVARGEIRRGVVKSPVARRLHTLREAYRTHTEKLVEEHKALHVGDGGKEADHDCDAFQVKTSHIEQLVAALDKLVEQAIAEEHPKMAFNAINLRKGWVLVSPKNHPWIEATLSGYDDSIFPVFTDQLHNAVTGRHMDINEKGLDPVAVGEEVVATLEDERVQTLRALTMDVGNEFAKIVPKGLEKMDLQRVGELTLNEYFAYRMFENHSTSLSSGLQEMFWFALRESLPMVASIPHIGIRRAWEVVKRTPRAARSSPGNPLQAILGGREMSLNDLLEALG